MLDLHEAIQPILSLPTPEALVALQGALLAFGEEDEAAKKALEVTGHFHTYLGDLRSKLTSRNYSELASKLDIGAVGAVALEHIVASGPDEFWKRLVLGGAAEGLMVAASRQYVKGWAIETGLVHTQAAWYLTEALWRASSEMQPDIQPEQRWEAIQTLLAPAYDPKVPASAKAVLLGRIYQILLLTYLARLSPGS
jgi:hypothetical protein